MSVVVLLDGVVRNPRNQAPISEGVLLYKTLNELNRVIILADHKERSDIWLKKNNMAKSLDDIIQVSDSVVEEPRLASIKDILSKGRIEFVVTDDVDFAKALLELSINVLVFLHPRYAKPEFRPDGRAGVKSWTAINNELDKQQGLLIEDIRLSEGYDPTDFEEDYPGEPE
jgi:hypothetical protein